VGKRACPRMRVAVTRIIVLSPPPQFVNAGHGTRQ
jgi:hypothetical protein